MTDHPRFRDACHEAGHAFGYFYSFMDLDVVSIRVGAGHTGVCMPAIREALHLKGHPLLGMDSRQRQKADQILVAILMGREAELVLAGPLDREAGLVIPPRAVVPAAALAADGRLTVDEASRLENAEADESPDGDYSRAIDLAIDIVGFETAVLYVAWLQAEAHRLAVEYATTIHALVNPLLREEAIGGQKVAAIFYGALERSRTV